MLSEWFGFFAGSAFLLKKAKSMIGYHQYQSCIEACLRCAAVYHHCASSCTQEDDVKRWHVAFSLTWSVLLFAP
jgi:hypothetical protein